MNKLSLIILFVFVSLTWTACTEDDDEKVGDGKPTTNTELLTAKTWVVATITINPPLDGVSDFLSLVPCYKDNRFNFTATAKSAGNYTQNEGNEVCDDSKQETSGEWNFSASEKIINISDDEGGFNNFNINELSETTFSFSGITTFDQDYTVTFTYIAQ